MNDPGCEQGFEDELARIAGLNPFGEPILRRVWGGTAEKWEGAGWCLKYPSSAQPDWGFEWTENGKTCFSWSLIDVPSNVIPLAIERTKSSEKGDEHHYVERWRDPEFLIASGRFIHTKDDDGTQILPDSPLRVGHYDYYVRLERKDGSYHPADNEALMVIKAMWEYEHAYSLTERNQHVAEDRGKRREPRTGTHVASI